MPVKTTVKKEKIKIKKKNRKINAETQAQCTFMDTTQRAW